MSNSPLIPSALDAGTQTFPVLTEPQIERVRAWGELRHVLPGDVLFRVGDVKLPFYVILSGKLDILQPSMEGERPIVSHQKHGEFTGEMSMISGQPCLARGLVSEEGDFIQVQSAALRDMLARDAELNEILLRAFILRRLELIRHGYSNVVLMGSRHSARTLELREFLGRNSYPYRYVDLDVDKASQELLDRFNVKVSEIPVVVINGSGHVLRGPTVQEVATCLGLNAAVDEQHARDLIIIGAGPAGLAGAVYAASEGLDVLIIETHAPGGQAGSSSKIENYLGFPTGISGYELASRATTQAQKFGASMMIARTALRLDCASHPYTVHLEEGGTIRCRAILIATGARYNKLSLPNQERFEGRGIYYGATYIESQLCGDDEVAVVGGGNSAGQAAIFLSQTAPAVHMLVRAGELRSTMSRYLIQRLTENPHIRLHYNTEVVGLEGNDQLERIAWRDKLTGEISTHDVPHLFIMTGASPCTDWVSDCLALDKNGFILTGRDLVAASNGNFHWSLEREPQMLETSLPGVFAVGDVRSGNVKRVASAVGEGAIAVHMVHRVLAEV